MGRKQSLSRRTRAAASVAAGASMSAYQGASHTDLALRDWQPGLGSPDADLLPELGALTSRARAGRTALNTGRPRTAYRGAACHQYSRRRHICPN